MFNLNAYSSAELLNAFEKMGAVGVAPGAEGASGAASTDSTDTGWSVVSG
ncbi:hypothetical protein ACIG0C_26145 [Kitasatospora aureofaciens]|nr:hypothetical protein [Kitasatospora aureofaciens]UKZ07269.1 hypothetical protein BOQ63_025210 [Streptomyces viridifaciens]HJD83987.1 hypothetical protein [Kitasatospora aureofaciens]